MTEKDRSLIRQVSREPAARREILRRYGDLIFSSALRRTGNPEQAARVTHAVVLVLGRRARRLGRKIILAGWLFQLTALVCRAMECPSWFRRWGRRWFRRAPKAPADADFWTRLCFHLDDGVTSLPARQRDAVVVGALLGQDPASDGILDPIGPKGLEHRERGLRKLGQYLRRRGLSVGTEELRVFCSTLGNAGTLPEGWADEIAGEGLAKAGSESVQLARRVLWTMAWGRWRRRLAIAIPSLVLALILAGGTLWYLDSREGHSRLLSMLFVWSVKREASSVPGLAQPAGRWPARPDAPRLQAAEIRAASDLYRSSNIWVARLEFSRDQWEAMEPDRIKPLPHFFQPDGTVLLRNPEAKRSGLAGVLGFDFNWVHADMEFGGRRFTNAGVRVKGNGTYLGSMYGEKRACKVDLNKYVRGQKLAGLDELNFNNLVNDSSFMSDALGYRFFRDAGVPAPRTAYAYLSVTVDGPEKPLGLFAMVEPVDGDFARERFGGRNAPIFKPVTYALFEFVSENWNDYAETYDLKTEATAAQRQRIVDFSRLVTSADDSEFSRRVGEFLDLEAYARFLACQVLLSNYDGPLSTGQNFYLYLDPISNRIGFIPWDLDLAWGGFFLLGTRSQRERASIWHPWVGRNRFMERVLAVDEFRRIYRVQLERLLGSLFKPGRLHQQVDEMAALLRDPVSAESDFRRRKFDQAVGDQPVEGGNEKDMSSNRPAHQLKRFMTNRSRFVRQQLDGKSDGVILERKEQ